MDAELMFMVCCWGIVAVGLFLRWVIENICEAEYEKGWRIHDTG